MIGFLPSLFYKDIHDVLWFGKYMLWNIHGSEIHMIMIHKSIYFYNFIWLLNLPQWTGSNPSSCHLITCKVITSPGLATKWREDWQYCLTHWGWDKMAAISQTSFVHTFSWMKTYELRLVNFIILGGINKIPALGTSSAPSHYLNPWWYSLLMHLWVTQPQWVKLLSQSWNNTTRM